MSGELDEMITLSGECLVSGERMEVDPGHLRMLLRELRLWRRHAQKDNRSALVKGSVMATGTVKWFSDKKGYGFIKRDGDSDLFVHHTGIKGDGFKSLAEGQEVSFEIGQGEKGPLATDVEVIQ